MSINEILFEGLETTVDSQEFNRRSNAVFDLAIKRVISDTFGDKIQWTKTLENGDQYTASATVVNHKGEFVEIPVLFYTNRTDYTCALFGYLVLGTHEREKSGLCKDTLDKDVERLATDYFNIADINRPLIQP